MPDIHGLIGSAHNGTIFNGTWKQVKATTVALEPATGAALGAIGLATPEDVRAGSAMAAAAQSAWAQNSPDDRSACLARAAEAASLHGDEIVGWIMRESGSTRPKAQFELGITIKALQLAAAMPMQASGLILPSEAGLTSLARRRPRGVVGVISPFNFPLYLAVRAVAPALAVGNSVVLKPDPRTAICGGYLIARLFELAGLPQALLHVLPGYADAGEAICNDPHVAMVQFTGSTAAGRIVGQNASKHLKKVSLELGGKNSLIILGDADLELAVKNAAWATYLHQGQICMSAGRILVHASIVREFASLLAQKAAALPVGNPAEQDVAIGPMISQGQFDHTCTIVDRSVAEGAKMLTGGPAGAPYYRATVLTDVSSEMPAFNEEIFGPVAVVVPFKTDEEAVALANRTDYGLSVGIISRDIGRAMTLGDRLHAGLVHINDQTVNDHVVNPFGGVGQSGNGSSIGGPANWEEFTHWQWLTLKASPPPYPI